MPLERNTLRNDIECPGDTVPYNCSITSNSEAVQLTWRVTLPGMSPLNVTLDNSSISTVQHLGVNITSVLIEFRTDEYAESVIFFTVLSDVAMNGTKLSCISEDLNEESATVFFNISGTILYCDD